MLSRILAKLESPTLSKIMASIEKTLPIALTTTAVSSFTAAMIYENQREHDITAEKFGSECDDIVKDASQFEVIGEPNHGSLTAKVVRDTKTGNEYVSKAAHSRRALVNEFMIANFLHAIRENQPECLILQTENESGTHFQTLSRKYPNNQDLENFISAGRVNELKSKTVTGLEASLAANNMTGKQRDDKLANLLIDDKFNVTTIDHERAFYPGFGFLNSGKVKFSTDPVTLVGNIRDLHDVSDDNKSGLAGDSRAKEFGNIAVNSMKAEKIKEYYADVAKADTNQLIQNCFRLADHSTLFKPQECTRYREHFQKIQELAAKHAI